jgi:hypothetical protein
MQQQGAKVVKQQQQQPCDENAFFPSSTCHCQGMQLDCKARQAMAVLTALWLGLTQHCVGCGASAGSFKMALFLTSECFGTFAAATRNAEKNFSTFAAVTRAPQPAAAYMPILAGNGLLGSSEDIQAVLSQYSSELASKAATLKSCQAMQ